MRIVLTTPLYPPDIEEPAPYIKELAKRLAPKHSVTVITYGYLPEKISGVEIITIDKKRVLPLRLFAFARALYKNARSADIVYTQHGPSVELPAALVTLLTRTPLVMRLGDARASARASSHFFLRLIKGFALARASALVPDSPLPKVEILPFQPKPTAAIVEYERSWEKHLEQLSSFFHYEN